MENYEHSSREEYYNHLIKEITRIVEESPPDLIPDLDESFLDIWKEKIEKYVDESFLQYFTESRSNYMLTDEEFQKSFEEAGLEYADRVINNLVDKDLLEVSISKDGEMLCGLTDKGKKLIIENKK